MMEPNGSFVKAFWCQMVSFFGERLREERVRLGLTQTEFGAAFGVTKKTQMLYEAGERFPDAKYLAAAAAEGVDAQYVLTGERSGRSTDTDMPPDEQLLLDAYRALGTSKKKQLLAELIAGAPGKKTARAAGVTVTGNGNRTAGGTYHEK